MSLCSKCWGNGNTLSRVYWCGWGHAEGFEWPNVFLLLEILELLSRRMLLLARIFLRLVQCGEMRDDTVVLLWLGPFRKFRQCYQFRSSPSLLVLLLVLLLVER